MIFLRKRDKAADAVAQEVMRPLWQRWIFFLCLWIGIFWAFWYRFDQQAQNLATKHAFLDEQRLLSSAEKNSINQSLRLFRENLGVHVIVHIRENLELPRMKGNTLFIGLNPEGDDALIAAHGLVNQLLQTKTYDERLRVENELKLCLAQGPPAPCLQSSLTDLLNILQ